MIFKDCLDVPMSFAVRDISSYSLEIINLPSFVFVRGLKNLKSTTTELVHMFLCSSSSVN